MILKAAELSSHCDMSIIFCVEMQVQHIIENGKLHLVLYSTKEIPPSTEVTIPFDFDFKSW